MWGFLGSGLFIFMFSEVDFESLCKFAPREHNAPSAAFAFQPNIRAETRYSPLIGPTWMLFAESQVIVEAKVGQHGFGSLRWVIGGWVTVVNIIN
jgi:hypothetical protein